VVLNFQALSKEYKIVLISKPSVPFIDSVFTSSNGMPIYPESDEYRKRLSLGWRVESANAIINELVKAQPQANVTVLGFSEGAQVGPYVAEANEHVDQLILFAGNGLNQFFDPIISARLKANTGQLNEKDAQEEIDSLFAQYKKIYAQPTSTKQQWWGHTYQRWASFTVKDPLDALQNLNIPIYIANGSLDENSVLSADYIYLDFLRLGKTNLTYKTYPNYDHQFNELLIENGQIVNVTPRLDDAVQVALKWLSENKQK
jgi:pimeloyl-ACP methyl ester carboxylesterase